MLSDTKFADCKLPLRQILQIVFTFAANAKGISAIQMARQHGICHKTAGVGARGRPSSVLWVARNCS